MSKVKYEVVGKCFVNGSYMEPVKGRTVIVEAAPGLAGPSLKLIEPEPPPMSLPLTDETPPQLSTPAVVDPPLQTTTAATPPPQKQPGGPQPAKARN